MPQPIPENIQASLRRYADRQAGPEDLSLIESWNNSFDDEAPMPHEVEAALGRIGLEVHENLIRAIQQEQRPIRYIPVLRWSAAIVFLAIAATWLLVYETKRPPVKSAIILPGSSKAVLTLSDGRQIPLDTGTDQTIADANGVGISTVIRGQINYNQTAEQDKTAYNTLATPRGGQFRIRLPDGSLVWLNAASKIHYPLAFRAASRAISLEGEAYFEIKPDPAHPFIVKTTAGQIQVLGTSFDVMAYDDEPAEQATLVTGSIRVTNAKAGAQVLLQPGQQVGLPAGTDRLLVTRPDLAAVLAWKNGEIRYDGVQVGTIMRQIARWYDVEIAYEGPLPTTEFAGSVSRMEDIRDLLGVLEDTRSVHFRIEGKKIIVISGPAPKN